DLHVTSIFVTHDQEEALEVADRVVLMNAGKVEQVGSPQQVWNHPASPFVYGFLGDVNLFHGRAHEGVVQIGADEQGLHLDSPEHHDAQDAKAFAYVRPHDLEVQRYAFGDGTGALTKPRGIVARLSRAILIGPIARLELTRVKPSESGETDLIEAHLSAQEFQELNAYEGETLLITPRKARVFVA
ncbi:MAG: TOBE-like domain-containing protein, partial [Betaproteobacteria bacterium]